MSALESVRHAPLSARLRLRLRDVTAEDTKDAGVSLVELIVTMIVASIVLVLVGSMFVSVAKLTTNTQLTRDGVAVATNATNVLSRGIRSATDNQTSATTTDPAVVVAGSTSLTIYSYANAVNPTTPSDQTNLAPWLIQFSLDAKNQIVEKRWVATASGSYWKFVNGTSATPKTTRTLSGLYVQDTTGTLPLFQYFDASMTNLGSSPSLSDIAFIKINVNLRSDSNPNATPIIITNTVGMPNLGLETSDS